MWLEWNSTHLVLCMPMQMWDDILDLFKINILNSHLLFKKTEHRNNDHCYLLCNMYDDIVYE